MDEELYVIGAEFPELKFQNFQDWFIHFTDTSILWKLEPTYVVVHFLYIFGGIATLIHALSRGGRLPYLWLGTILHGLTIECLCFISPDIDNYWHSQTPITFLGRRLPIHIIFLYPCYIYNSSIGVAKMKLPRWAEPFAVGLGSVLIDIPYDIVSINFLHWTWHDTDPNIADRHYWVPWNSYYFHSCFAASFTFWFHFSRKLICKNESKWKADSVPREIICTIIPGVMGTIGGIAMFIPVYHPLHDIFKIHSEVTYFIILTTFLLIVWSADRTKNIKEHIKFKIHWSTWILILHLVLHYTWFLTMVVFFNPEEEIAIGLKEPIGPCNEYSPVQTVFGLVLKKRKYLCATDYDEKYFDWHCLPGGNPPSNGSYWYTACGVPLPNRAEYVTILGLIWILGAVVYGNLHFRSYGDGVFESVKLMKLKKK